MRILVVEDERSLANTIVEVLERECYVVDVCYNGLKVLDKIEAQIYDVIVLDIMLPGCKGYYEDTQYNNVEVYISFFK